MSASSPNKKVLVIDDEPSIVAYLTTLLEDHGYDTCSTTDALRGTELARTECPDLICLDIMMPKLSGFALYRAIKLDPATRAIPVVFVSAFSREKDLRTGSFRRYFPDERIPQPEAYVEKPIDATNFLKLIASVTTAESGHTPNGLAREERRA